MKEIMKDRLYTFLVILLGLIIILSMIFQDYIKNSDVGAVFRVSTIIVSVIVIQIALWKSKMFGGK